MSPKSYFLSATVEVVLCSKEKEVKENIEVQGFGSQWICHQESISSFLSIVDFSNKDVEQSISDFLSTVNFSNTEALGKTFEKTYPEYEYVILCIEWFLPLSVYRLKVRLLTFDKGCLIRPLDE